MAYYSRRLYKKTRHLKNINVKDGKLLVRLQITTMFGTMQKWINVETIKDEIFAI